MKMIGLVLEGSERATVAIFDQNSGECRIGSFDLDESFSSSLTQFVRTHARADEVVEIGLELLGRPIPVLTHFMDFLKGVGQFGAARISVDSETNRLFISDVPEMMKEATRGQRAAKLIYAGVSSAFFAFQTGRDASAPEAASTLAKICSTTGSYRFFRSRGYVQSAQDVAVFLASAHEVAFVLSANDWYCLRRSALTRKDAQRGDIYLTYETGKADYKELGEINALKFGLLNTAREYAFHVYCGAISEIEALPVLNVMNNNVVEFPDEYRVC